MQGIYHHKRMYSDIPNLKLNNIKSMASPAIASEAKVHVSRDLLHYSTNVQKSLSKGKQRSPTPNQNVKKESQLKNFQPIPKIKPKIGSELMNISRVNGNKVQTKLSGISPFLKKVATPIKNNQSAANSRNTSNNRIKPNEPKIPSIKKFKNIPIIKNYLPPKSFRKFLTNRDEELNLTNISKNSKMNDTNNSGLISDRLLRNVHSNSKSVSRNSKNSSKSRSDTPKFKSDTIKNHIETNLSSIKINSSSRGNSLNVLNNSKNINKTHNNLKSASNSKSPKPQPKIPTIASKRNSNKEIVSKIIPKIINKIPKANNYSTIHAMTKMNSSRTNNYNINKRLIPNPIDMNYSKLYHSLLNNSNTNTNINDISTNSSKIDQKIINNPSNNSIVSNLTNVTKEKDKNDFSCNIPFKCYANDTISYNKLEGTNESFKSDVKFKEITTSPLIRAKNDKAITGRLVLGDSAESKIEGKNLFDLFKKSDDSKRSLQHNQNTIPINMESYMKRIKSNQLQKETKKNIKMIHEFSHIGYADDGTKKMNQDNYFKFKNLGGNPNHFYFGVCDGHGLHGHEVSGYLKENLPAFLNHQMKVYSQESIDAIIEETFLEINFNLHTSETIDTLYSGSTCVSLIYSPEKLVCANVGDSRAVLGKFRDGKWINYDLTRDHKPSEKDEAQRIYEKGGRIKPFRDDETDEFVGPPRVWLKDDDVPGLAMSRSFGDRVASSVGVIAEPEITEYKFVDEDKFIIIASDGVWEFIESDECVDLIKDFYIKKDPVGCCESIYQEACKRWIEEEECIDDITMVLIFLED